MSLHSVFRPYTADPAVLILQTAFRIRRRGCFFPGKAGNTFRQIITGHVDVLTIIHMTVCVKMPSEHGKGRQFFPVVRILDPAGSIFHIQLRFRLKTGKILRCQPFRSACGVIQVSPAGIRPGKPLSLRGFHQHIFHPYISPDLIRDRRYQDFLPKPRTSGNIHLPGCGDPDPVSFLKLQDAHPHLLRLKGTPILKIIEQRRDRKKSIGTRLRKTHPAAKLIFHSCSPLPVF